MRADFHACSGCLTYLLACRAHAPRWWPAPIAAFASGSRRFLPACAGRCAKPKAAPRPGPRPRRRTGGSHRRFLAARSGPGRVSEGLQRQLSRGGSGNGRRRSAQESPRGPYRQELLYALRRCQDTDTAAWNAAPALQSADRSPEDANHALPGQSLASAGFAAHRRLQLQRHRCPPSGSPSGRPSDRFRSGPAHPGAAEPMRSPATGCRS